VKIVSVNVGLPRPVTWEGRPLATSIFKSPVSGPVAIRRFQMDGDRQADPRVHGGEHKAVYAYPSEHYGFWREALGGAGPEGIPGADLPWGAFGENLTTEGLSEESVRLGDVLRVGTAVLRVTQPRMPCVKLNARFGRPDMVRDFLASRRSGFYCTVVTAGEVGAGDAVEVLSREPEGLTVRELVNLYAGEPAAPELLERALRIPILSDKWRETFRQRLEGAFRSSPEGGSRSPEGGLTSPEGGAERG
jgi:MOSC domain-containing protein YiiM